MVDSVRLDELSWPEFATKMAAGVPVFLPLGFVCALLGVNVEANSKDAEKLLANLPVSFPVLFDTENKVSKMYDVNAMPSTVFIDRKGNVRYLHRGYKAGDEGEYLNQIRALLKE